MAVPGVGILIDPDRLLSGRAEERNNPYFISIQGIRIYGSSPAQVVAMAARDNIDFVEETPGSAPGLGVLVDPERLQGTPGERQNPYFITLGSSRVYSSIPEAVVEKAADPKKRSFFGKNQTTLEKAKNALGKGASMTKKGAIAAGKAMKKGAIAAGKGIKKGAIATGKAISSAFKSLKEKVASYRQKGGRKYGKHKTYKKSRVSR